MTGDWSEALSIILETFLDSESKIQWMSAPETENAIIEVQTVHESLPEQDQVEWERMVELFDLEMDILSDLVLNLLRERGIPFHRDEDVNSALFAVLDNGRDLENEADYVFVRRVREIIEAGEEDRSTQFGTPITAIHLVWQKCLMFSLSFLNSVTFFLLETYGSFT